MDAIKVDRRVIPSLSGEYVSYAVAYLAEVPIGGEVVELEIHDVDHIARLIYIRIANVDVWCLEADFGPLLWMPNTTTGGDREEGGRITRLKQQFRISKLSDFTEEVEEAFVDSETILALYLRARTVAYS